MSILINSGSRILVQGLTGHEGMFHARQMLEYGTDIVAGCTPGKGGTDVLGIPVFDSCAEAVEQTGADVSVVFVPAQAAADAACEASAAGIKLVIVITEHIPVFDMIRAREFLSARGTKLIGPNCPGVITPGECKAGIMPGYIFKPGPIGLISRSGTLTYEAAYQLTRCGLGQSTCVGIGGDPVPGMDFTDILKLFRDDEKTKAVCMIGEIGGNAEERAAGYIKATAYPKPVFGFIAGLTAPAGKRMGHAGAVISGSKGRGEDKIAAFLSAGITVVHDLGTFGETVSGWLNRV